MWYSSIFNATFNNRIIVYFLDIYNTGANDSQPSWFDTLQFILKVLSILLRVFPLSWFLGRVGEVNWSNLFAPVLSGSWSVIAVGPETLICRLKIKCIYIILVRIWEKGKGHGVHVGWLVNVSDYWGKDREMTRNIYLVTSSHGFCWVWRGTLKWVVGTPQHYPPTIPITVSIIFDVRFLFQFFNYRRFLAFVFRNSPSVLCNHSVGIGSIRYHGFINRSFISE